MGLIITPQIEIDNYFEKEDLSQSVLKKLLKGLDSFKANTETGKALYYEEKDYFVIGSAVDTILTGEEGEFDKQYYVSTLEKKPSDTEKSIVNQVFDEVTSNIDLNNPNNDISFKDCTDMILLAANEHSWQPKWKEETRINKLVEKCEPYFEDLKRAFGKQITSSEQMEKIERIVYALRTDSRTAKYFQRGQQALEENVDFYYQLPIYFIHEGIECKALMDLVIVVTGVDGRKTIIPCDLKTMHGNTLHFLTNLKKHRYDIQAAWYTLALTHWLKQQNWEGIEKSTIKDFIFIVESSSYPGRPLVYEITPELLKVGKKGRPEITKDGVMMSWGCKGYEELVEEYKYYEENEWREDIILSKVGDGPIALSWDKILTV